MLQQGQGTRRKTSPPVPSEFLFPSSFLLLSQTLILELTSLSALSPLPPCSRGHVMRTSQTPKHPKHQGWDQGTSSSLLTLEHVLFILLLGSFNTWGKRVTPSSLPILLACKATLKSTGSFPIGKVRLC